MNFINNKNEKRMLFAILPLILITCLIIIYMRNFYRVSDMTKVQSVDGVFDLSGFDLDDGFFRLEGDVVYLPEIMTPVEFTQNQQNALVGNPWDIPYATSKIRIIVPVDRTYTITCGSIDYAHRVYVNGELRFEAGNPANQKEAFQAGHAQMMLDVKAENGEIILVQQAANFVHREGGGHSNLYFGTSSNIQTFFAQIAGPEYVIVAFFITLFLVHLILFIIRRTYKANLIFALLCFMWMLRSGITGAKVFYLLIPSLPWELAFRLEYLTIPAAAILLILLIRNLFIEIPQQWFVRTFILGSIMFSIMCICLDTLTLSNLLFYYEAFFTVAIAYLMTRFIMKMNTILKNQDILTEQMLSLCGIMIFMIASINDALYHSSIYYALGVPLTFSMTGPAMLIFSFFQMSAMFLGTLRETMLAHEREQKAEAEKTMLLEMNQFKNAFYADISHEMKTPLTVIAVNAQFAAQNIQAGAIDEETIADLSVISNEAKRLAQMVTSLVGIGRMQGIKEDKTSLDITLLISETLRMYQTLFDRKHNVLTSYIEPNLPMIMGNADQLIQVFINILSNANRHTSEDVIHVDVKRVHDIIQFSIKDHGEGISEELLPHVFERYCHGTNGSSGLGLSICKTIIEEHGGTIIIESMVNKGTTVYFTLPVGKELAI